MISINTFYVNVVTVLNVVREVIVKTKLDDLNWEECAESFTQKSVKFTAYYL